VSVDHTCFCCNFPNPVGGLKDYSLGAPAEPRPLCEPCANTLAGEHDAHPGMYKDTPTLKAICWGINQLREDLRLLRPGW
jgi:hypothetical protein